MLKLVYYLSKSYLKTYFFTLISC